MNTLTQFKKSQGMSLVELMVSMAIGLILIGGTASVYLASKRSYVEVERMSRVTQNSRFALQLLSEAVQHAGFVGEIPMGSIELDPNLNAVNSDCSDLAAAYDIDNYLLATESSGAGAAFGCINDALPNTSVLLVKNVRPMRLIDSDDNGTIDSPEGLNATTTYVVSNNIRGILFDGADAAPTVTEGGDVPDGSAWEYQAQIYYIRDTAAGPQLSRRVLAWSGGSMSWITEDLILGVENMSFSFGLDTNADGDIDTYKPVAAMVPIDWNNVYAIECDVLVRSETTDPQYTDTKTYNLSGIAAIGPLNDNFHRMVMQNTVSLRNPYFVIRGNL